MLQLQTFNCERCGGSLEFGADGLYAKCKYCGTEHFFREDKSEALILEINVASDYLQKNDFDNAITHFGSILKRYPKDAEAAWGLAVSTYGIVYTHDDKTGKMIPTCSRIVKESILDSAAYKTAIANAAEEQRPIYESEAKFIDKLQKKIKRAMQDEEDFDVFISFKARDEHGAVTEDAVIARNIYDELTRRGIKAFFSEVTLRDRIGEEFEPIIYRALYSCKFFILVSTREEYIEAPWVKNEWTRFRDRASEENLSGAATAVFKNIPAYSLPRAFQGQGIDLDKHPFDYSQLIADNLVKRFGLDKKEEKKSEPTPQKKPTEEPKKEPASAPVTKKEGQKKPIIAVLVALTIIGAVVLMSLLDVFSCETPHDVHPDENRDNVCDDCGITICTHRDEDGNLLCDYCNMHLESTDISDPGNGDNSGNNNGNNSGTDTPEEPNEPGAPDEPGETPECTEHADEDRDHKCDVCGETALAYTRDGKYIYFGEYPQTVKADGVDITDTVDSRGYFLGSDGCYYAKVVASPYGNYVFSNVESIVGGESYYFKVEPIRWRILSKDSGGTLLLCDSIIAGGVYDSDKNINYAISDIRVWLNNTFYSSVFTEFQKDIILSAAIGSGSAALNDNVFLISLGDAQNVDYGFHYGFSQDAARIMQTTDYARASGVKMSVNNNSFGTGSWWLRAKDNDTTVPYIMQDGMCLAGAAHDTGLGIVPAIKITPCSADTDTDRDHECDYCGEILSAHTDTDRNYTCDYCGSECVACAEHIDVDLDHECEYCKSKISEHIDSNSDAICEYCSKSLIYNVEGNYVYFGEYPQTLKADNVTVSANSNELGYYLGSDGYYYAKVVASPYGDDYRFSTDDTIVDGTVYYFKLEPIRWRILKTEGNRAFILCDSIISNGAYDTDSNNYENSEVRNWLNSSFYNAAFSDLQSTRILTTTVDNSLSSTGFTENPFVSIDTEDRIFLLSYSEAIDAACGFPQSAEDHYSRQMLTSDYARAVGVYMFTDTALYGNGCWWLRSPSDRDGYALGVDYDGNLSYDGLVKQSMGAVVPALWLELDGPCTEHADKDRNHECDYCGASCTVPCTAHEDEDKDHKCDYCGGKSSEHTDEDRNHECDYCGASYTAPCTAHEDEDKDHQCDYCGASCTVPCTTHEDDDLDHLCDYCGEKSSEHIYAINSYECDYCGALNSDVFSYTGTADGYKITGLKDKTITDLVIPGSVTSIGDYAFEYCYNLTSVTIPGSVTSIGERAFYDCDSLVSVTIGNGVTSIGEYAFTNCSNLASVTILNSVTSIGVDAFSGCYKLVEVINYSDLSITEGSADNGYVAYYAKTVHKGESKIVREGDYIFITLDEVNYLVTYVGTETDITLPEDYNGEGYVINDRAFYYNDSITSVTIPDSVTSIGSWAFFSCDSLISVTIGSNVTTIGSQAFDFCYKLVEIVNHSSLDITGVNGSVPYIHTGESKIVKEGDYTFVTLDEVNYLLGYKGDETDITLPENYNGENYVIKGYAFHEDNNITSVTIPNSVTSIGDYAFSNCTGLTSVTIPNSVTSIGDSAFYYCDSLVSVTIPDSVTSIGESAFSHCYRLVSVTIPDSVTSIGEGAFYNCDNLTSITVDEGNTAYKDIDGNLYTKDGKTLIQYAIGKSDTSFTIPDSVTSIGDYAFAHSYNLVSVTIPDSVEKIGDFAFYHCWNISELTLGNSITSIGAEAFYYCYSLTSVTIPESVTSIGKSAFESCSKLTRVEIGSGVTTIGSYAFSSCTSLLRVYFKNPNGWKVGSIFLPSTILSDASNAATYLKTTYVDKEWTRS